MTVNLLDVGSGFKRTAINSNFETIETELNTQVLKKDGSQQLEADLDFNSQKGINLADGINNQDAVTVKQLNSVIAGSGPISSILQARETQKGSEATSRIFTLAGIAYQVGANTINVYRNGQRLSLGRDYSESSATTITLTFDPNDDDDFDFITNELSTSEVTSTNAITHTRYGVDNNLATYLNDIEGIIPKDTVAEMTSMPNVVAGQTVVKTKEFSTGKGDGAIYDVISGTGSADGYSIIAHDSLGVSFVRRSEQENKFNSNTATVSGKIHSNSTTDAGLAPVSNGYVDVVLPYGVVIGDSIAKGATGLDSRLDDSTQVPRNLYRPDIKNKPGQIPYELSRHLNVPVINQAIGGETTSQVKLRWERDVLNIAGYVGPGTIAHPTLEFDGQLPFFVYLHAGTNDIAAGATSTTIIDNIKYFAQSCVDNNIILIVATIGPTSVGTDATRRTKAQEVNDYIRGLLRQEYNNVYIADYEKWATTDSEDQAYIRNDHHKFADNIHPSQEGYKSYVDYIMSTLDAPIRLAGLTLDRTNAHPNFARVDTFFANGHTHTQTTTTTQRKPFDNTVDEATFSIDVLDYPKEPVIRILPLTTTTVTGTGTATGWTALTGTYTSCRPPLIPTIQADATPMPLNMQPNGAFLDWPSGTTSPPTGLLPQTGSITFARTAITDPEMQKLFQYSCAISNSSGSAGFYAYRDYDWKVAGKHITVVAWVLSPSEIVNISLVNLTSGARIPSDEGRFGSYALFRPSSEWKKVVYHVNCTGCLPTDSVVLTIAPAASTGTGTAEIAGLAVYEGYIEEPYFTINPND